jgi:bis(5'-nucleosidyl)-tetraphosphatase
MKFETSYGIIPLIEQKGEWHVLLICHKKGSYWAFPKGHGEAGEEPKETAARELYEETGLTIKHILKEEPLKESYIFTRESELINKTVFYFLAEVQGKLKLQASEVWDAKWVKLSEASQIITFPESQNILKQTLKILL